MRLMINCICDLRLYAYFSIQSLKVLEELDLSDNKFQTLPDNIGMMKSLKKLDLSSCDLSELPERCVNKT